ncbi:MAG TPA: CU044_2847 family protein [Ktedonobacteraceae bacterium]|nr:CU044_2847 family protein [Ktedonobacteraceae bacterium]
MGYKLIELADGTLVEVEASENDVQQISGHFADKVGETFDVIKPVLLKACQPVAAAVQELRKEVEIEQVEVELALSFEGEGNIYITKTKLGANLTIKMTLKGKKE